MAARSTHLFELVLGVLVHFVLFYSAFDIYFTSPIVENARPQLISRGPGVARRLVIFSADGLRSRTFFEHPNKSQFLHELIRNGKAAFGISRSHVPTESRPGHVALFAGIYEDVSAVTRGWKHNPVDFDHVFNRSARSFLFGSPDIVPLFAAMPTAHSATYSPSEEQFFSADAAGLDRWVFEKMEDLLKSNRSDLHDEKAVFFLHLLGLDTNGHGFKPHSREYVDNIRVVDEGIRAAVRRFDEFFADNKTVFLFTADHGMTDWGSHGDGSDDEVLTPFVLWGAGVRTSATTQLVNQIDMAPLQSALLNIAVPVNSMGVLPLQVIEASEKYKYQVACGNLKQMVEQFGLKRKEKERNTLPFLFNEAPQLKSEALRTLHKNVESLADKRRFQRAADLCVEWIPRVRDALIFYHRYHRRALGFAISSLFISWNLFLVVLFSRSDLPCGHHSIWIPSRVFRWAIGLEFALALYQKWQPSHLLYIALPVYILSALANLLDKPAVHYARWTARFVHENLLKILFSVVLVSICISAFFDRATVSFVLLLISPLPLFFENQYWTVWSKVWTACCLLLTVFPLLPPVGRSPVPLLVFGSSVVFTGFLFLYRRHSARQSHWTLDYALALNGMTSLVVGWIGLTTDQQAIPLAITLFSWFSITLNLAVPLFADRFTRLVCFFAVLFVPFSLMSVAYESAFLLVFLLLLYAYTQMTTSADFHSARGKYKSSLLGPFEETEWWRALLLLVLIEVAFFGTGNLSSLNSFNPSFIRPFVTTFSPFLMAVLLVFKIATPFFLLSCAICATLQSDSRLITRCSVLLFVLTDTMAMVFFHCLKDEGSWLQIGITISNYSICLAMALVVFVLLNLSRAVMFAFDRGNTLDKRS